jgi:uncharacterized protein YraI
MTRTGAIIVAVFTAVLPAPSGAAAAEAFTAAGMTYLREGPGTDYSVIGRIPGGTPVSVSGCLQAFSWCQAEFGGMRGWISGTRLEQLHAQRPGRSVPIIEYSEDGAQGRDPVEVERILGQVTDRPGYCYALDSAGASVVVPCPE